MCWGNRCYRNSQYFSKARFCYKSKTVLKIKSLRGQQKCFNEHWFKFKANLNNLCVWNIARWRQKDTPQLGLSQRKAAVKETHPLSFQKSSGLMGPKGEAFTLLRGDLAFLLGDRPQAWEGTGPPPNRRSTGPSAGWDHLLIGLASLDLSRLLRMSSRGRV